MDNLNLNNKKTINIKNDKKFIFLNNPKKENNIIKKNNEIPFEKIPLKKIEGDEILYEFPFEKSETNEILYDNDSKDSNNKFFLFSNNIFRNLTNNNSLENNDIKNNKTSKIRIESQKWNFNMNDLTYYYQLIMIKNIYENNYNYYDYISRIALQQIKRKILSYKHQDVIKNNYNPNEFINYKIIIDKLNEIELKCHYCCKEMLILYDISREIKQWTVDRIDNDLGHNINNYIISCLECNLKKRKKDDKKFLFTKQLKIIKS